MAGPARTTTTTLEDIARKAGVSTMTVSRVLKHGGTYQRRTFAERAKKIRKIADKLGYRPNSAAMAMRAGHRNIARVDYGNRADETPWHYGGIDRRAAHEAVLAEAGLSVPRDLSVACFMGERKDYFGLDLSGILLPEARVGAQAVEMLMERIEQPARRLPPQAVPGKWRQGQTLAPPREGKTD